MLAKKKRLVDKALLKSLHDAQCFICGRTEGTAGHHLKTKGSGGDDVAENLLPLCVKHHREVHDIGTKTFCLKYGIKK